MPSPVSARRIGEWALRVLSLALMVVILMRSWGPSTSTAPAERVTQRDIGKALPRWSLIRPAVVHLSLDSVLPPGQRDWLAAISRSGTRVTWSGSRISETAAALTRIADPGGASELSAAVPARSVALIRDETGIIDSAIAVNRGIRIEIPGTTSRIGVSSSGTTAWPAAPDSIIFKRLLVEGAAGWETKFTIAALAERGWKIDAITHVAPGVDVSVGSPASPDTSRYAAVIAVDSTAALIARGADSFVRKGGGLVSFHDASGIGPRVAASVTLERRADGEVRASRVGSGRIIRIGYKDVWRSRMADNDSVPDPVAAQRGWLAQVVAAVAYTPRVAVAADSAADPAPFADMVDRIGPPAASARDTLPPRSEVPSSVLFGVLLVSLLLELASRRLRGVK
jgi:hypothetical protein